MEPSITNVRKRQEKGLGQGLWSTAVSLGTGDLKASDKGRTQPKGGDDLRGNQRKKTINRLEAVAAKSD